MSRVAVNPWTADALFVGPLIAARLAEQLPELREVLAIDELEEDSGEPKQTPAAVVLLSAMRPTNTSQHRNVAVVEQDWLVVLAVRSARRDANRNAQKFGPLISKTVSALQGWKPPGSNHALTWKPGPRPDYGKAISYLPLVFSIQVVTT